MYVVDVRVTSTTDMTDWWQMLVEKWDAIPQLVTSMRRKCRAIVVINGFSTSKGGPCLINEWMIKLPVCLVSSDFLTNTIHSTKQDSIAEIVLWHYQRAFDLLFVGATRRLNSAAKLTNAISLQLWHQKNRFSSGCFSCQEKLVQQKKKWNVLSLYVCLYHAYLW